MLKIFVIILSCFLSVSPVIAGDESLTNKQKTDAATEHEPFMRQAFKLAMSAGKNGNHTFGALLVHQGKVILTSENTVFTDNDSTRHAEINLVSKAKREISPKVLRQSIIYTSTAPCMFCCSAIWYLGINKVVYGVSYEAFEKLTGHKDNSIPCNKLYHETDKQLEWIGPILEEEGLKVYCYWPQESYRPLLLKKLEGCEGIEKPHNVETR